MANTPSHPISPGPIRDWLRGTTVWGIVPGWMLSLLFHGAMFGTMLSLTQMPSCRGDYSGEEGAGFREIGLRAREDANNAPAAGPADPGVAEVAANTPQFSASTDLAAPTISETPPVPLSLPNVSAAPAVVGIGPPPLAGVGGAPATAAAAMSVTSGGNPGSRGGGGGQGNNAPGQTSLFGVNDAGKKFVYVIDRSYSMEEHNAFRTAKAELLTSISRLTETQQFQVIFYNNEPLVLATRDDRFQMFFGTETQRLQISEQIRSISPDGGTRHLPAIQEALKFNPDVIFLLTDGVESELSKSELDSIKSRNRQGTRIHCIEFGNDPPPTTSEGQAVPNFLRKLADQNSGKYTYRNVKELGEGG